MKDFPLAKDLRLPINFVTEKHAWIGVTGSGKTYGAQKSAEQLWEAGAPFVVLDPKGDWWGLRLAVDGKRAGIPIPVFGGLHGDVPLEPTAGAIIADLIFDKHISAVVDVSQFDTDADRTRFVTGFLDRLYTRHKRAPTARHLYLEECQEFIPQNPQPGEQRMLHVAQRVQKMGRGVGLGTSLLTQRPQDVSKKALNQAQTIFLFRLMGSQEKKAMKEWISDKGLDADLMQGLPELHTGVAHVWSPAWLKLFRTIKIAAKTTFDASATPEVGAKTVVHDLAAIDLAGLKEAMAATVEKAKAEDPKELRARIAHLERELKRPLGLAPGKIEIRQEIVEVPVIPEPQLKRLEALVGKAANIVLDLNGTEKDMQKVAAEILAGIAKFKRGVAPMPRIVLDPKMAPGRVELRHPVSGKTQAVIKNIGGDEPMPPMRRRILSALAFLEGCGIRPAPKAQVAFFADASPNGGSYGDQVSALRTAGYLDYPHNKPGFVELTEKGRAVSTEGVNIPNSNEEMQERIIAKLPPMRGRILRAVLAAYPESMTKEEVAASANASATGGSFGDQVSALRSLGVIDYPEKGRIVATDVLFLKTAA